MKAQALLTLGIGLAGFSAMPGFSQGTKDAQLEAACRATEVSVPASCGCTIIKSRAQGLNDADLASLFKDDGHSNPVGEAKYSKFWQVKAQCMAEATMASLGVSPRNPLPGVPANMRPGMPLGTAPAVRTAPPPPPIRRDLVQTAPDKACDGSGFSGPSDIVECGDTGVLDTRLIYNNKLAAYPKLLSELKRSSNAIFADASKGRTRRDRYPMIIAWSLASANDPLISVTGADGDTSRGRLGGSQSLLWDSNKSRFIHWHDVFGEGLWEGKISRDYCALLRQRFSEERKRGGEEFRGCPDLDKMTVALVNKPNGTKALNFSASVGVLASYASSALYDGIELPVDAALLTGVQPPYRSAFGLTGKAPAISAPLRDRLGPVEQVLYGDIQANDDFHFMPAKAARFTKASQFNRLFDEAKPVRFMTISNEAESGYSLKLDGKLYHVKQTEIRQNPARNIYSDGVITVTISKGKSIYDNPAFGFSIDTITITKGRESDTFKAINFAGA